MAAQPRLWWQPYAAGPPLPPPLVRVVWAANLDAEAHFLRSVAPYARYVAFAVHYPGEVVRAAAAGADHNTLTAEQRYAAVKANVDALKPLQVGLAVGTHDRALLVWEFNLRGFDPATDPHSAESVAYLQRGRGMDLDAHGAHGVPAARLAAALRGSGLLHRPDVTWVAHAGAYHAAYLLKVVTGGHPLPGDVAGFLGAVAWFLGGGGVYDVACVAAGCPQLLLPAGLERVAERLGVARPLGRPSHAGAGAALALQAFLVLAFGVFGGNVGAYRGILKGLQVP